jgi:hypothetical protein
MKGSLFGAVQVQVGTHGNCRTCRQLFIVIAKRHVLVLEVVVGPQRQRPQRWLERDNAVILHIQTVFEFDFIAVYVGPK